MKKVFLQPGQIVKLNDINARVGMSGTIIDMQLVPGVDLDDGISFVVGEVFIGDVDAGNLFTAYMNPITGRLWYDAEEA